MDRDVQMPSASSWTERYRLLGLALLVEGGAGLAAVALRWACGIPWDEQLRISWRDIAWGCGGVVPLLVLFAMMYRSRAPAFVRIRSFVETAMGPWLAQARWPELLAVSVLAGVGEELLFRGALQPLGGLLASNALFAIVHMVTPTYALLAGGLGLYLGGLSILSQGLMAPILAHALYDFLALLWFARAARKRTVNHRYH